MCVVENTCTNILILYVYNMQYNTKCGFCSYSNRFVTLFKLLLYFTYLLIYLLTYSMVQSPSREANWFAASQEIPRISRNPKVHYRTHKRPPTVPILCPPNPVHIPTSYLLEIHPNIIYPSTPRSPQWSLSLRFPHQDPIRPPSPHPYAPHAQPISLLLYFTVIINQV